VKKLHLAAHEPDVLVYVLLKWVLLLPELKTLNIYVASRNRQFGAAHVNGIAAFINFLSVAQSALQRIVLFMGHYHGDCTLLWDALRRNNTLQEVSFCRGRFDEANGIALANCFTGKSTETSLSVWSSRFQGAAFGRVIAALFVRPSKLKSLNVRTPESSYDDDDDLDPIAEFEPFVNALRGQVDPSASFPKLKLTMTNADMTRLLADGLPDFTTCRNVRLWRHKSVRLLCRKFGGL
jgi:hypothetical protein